MTNTKNKRKVVWDLLKLYAMLSVVLDHTLSLYIPFIKNTQLYNFIFLSQIPLFMTISGFLFYSKTSKKPTIKELKKIIISLLVPFFSFTILKTFLSFRFEKVFYNIFYAIINPDFALWFLWALAIIEITMLLASYINSKLKIKREFFRMFSLTLMYLLLMVPFLIIYFFNREIFDIKLIVYYSIFFLYGLLLNLVKGIIKSKKICLTIIIVSFILLICVMIHHPSIILEEESIQNLLARIIGSVSVVNIFIIIGCSIQNYGIIKRVSSLGKYSLELYYIHLLLIKSKIYNFDINNISYVIIAYISVVLLSFLIVYLIKKNNTIYFILFGKTNSPKSDNNIS